MVAFFSKWLTANHLTLLRVALVPFIYAGVVIGEEDQTILEREPLERATQMGELMAFRHDGFWHCMDTKRDRDNLENFWASEKAPWKR